MMLHRSASKKATARKPNLREAILCAASVIIGGFMSRFFYAVPLALIVKQRLR